MKTYRLRFHYHNYTNANTIPFVLTIEVPQDTDPSDVWDIGESMAKGMGVAFGYIED